MHKVLLCSDLERTLLPNGMQAGDTVLAGDSGNDLPALTSGLQAVLVHNARADACEEALSVLKARGMAKRSNAHIKKRSSTSRPMVRICPK